MLDSAAGLERILDEQQPHNPDLSTLRFVAVATENAVFFPRTMFRLFDSADSERDARAGERLITECHVIDIVENFASR